MTAGRPPKPIATLEAQGTARRGRHDKRKIEPKSGSKITLPATLKGEAARFWKAEIPKLEAMGVLDGIDQRYLIGLATAWANWKSEQAAYDRGEVKITMVATAWATFDKIASRFGMNPVDRTKLATGDNRDDSDPFAEWLKRGGLN